MYWEYIGIIASNIPQKKIIAVSQWIARFNIRVSPKNAGVYLEISFAKFQDFPGLFSNSKTFKDFPGLVGTMKQKTWSAGVMANLAPD